MARRPVKLRESPIEKLRYALLDNRLVVGLVVTSLALAGLLVAIGLWTEREYALPAKQEEGEIVRFGPSPDRYEPGNYLLVVVRTQGGQLQTLSVTSAKLLHCRVGDRIRLIRHGRILSVRSRACAPRA